LDKLVPVLTYAGRKSVFGALERNESAGQILALGRRFGCASAFLTFGIDDVNHPNAIRFAVPSSNNRDFPAVVSSASQAEMKRGIRLRDGDEGYIPFHWSERFKTMIDNPVGAAIAYKQVVHDIMSILIGIKPSNYSGDNDKTLKTSFVSPDSNSIGINGTGWAFFGKTETTGSGSLHFHVVIWGGLSPELLESVADIPELCQKVASALDSMYCARIDKHNHVKDLTVQSMRQIQGLNRLRATSLKSKSTQTSISPSSSPSTTSDGKSISSHEYLSFFYLLTMLASNACYRFLYF
jgi:hypothetical protein